MSTQLPPCPSGRFWRIRPRDTLFRIAIEINSTVEEILRLNPGINPRQLQIGQVICLPEPAPCPSGIIWEVAAGDTLFSIAGETGTTVQELIRLNPGIDPNNLQPGQRICLPG